MVCSWFVGLFVVFVLNNLESTLKIRLEEKHRHLLRSIMSPRMWEMGSETTGVNETEALLTRTSTLVLPVFAVLFAG